MPRGRPLKSEIRQHIVDLLAELGSAYGYDLARQYNARFTPVTKRSIYHHLRKGLITKEFVIARVERSEGNYSWGSTSQKTYFSLGPEARPSSQMPATERSRKRGREPKNTSRI